MTEFHRTNINLYATDVEWLQHRYGRGWGTRVREIVNDHVDNARSCYKTKGLATSLPQAQWRKLNQIIITEPQNWDGDDDDE